MIYSARYQLKHSSPRDFTSPVRKILLLSFIFRKLFLLSWSFSLPSAFSLSSTSLCFILHQPSLYLPWAFLFIPTSLPSPSPASFPFFSTASPSLPVVYPFFSTTHPFITARYSPALFFTRLQSIPLMKNAFNKKRRRRRRKEGIMRGDRIRLITFLPQSIKATIWRKETGRRINTLPLATYRWGTRAGERNREISAVCSNSPYLCS